MVPLTQLQPLNIVERAAISVMELIGMHQRIEKQQKKIDNSEMLGTAGARLEEELRHLKLESQMLSGHLLETKRLLEYAENQREFCRRQVELLKKELAEVTNVAETKTRECIAHVDEQECLARELENASIPATEAPQPVLSKIISKCWQCSVIRTRVVART